MLYGHKKEKGAVTVFCVIVLFTMVLLGGVFIDGSRILLAKQMVRSSLNSAARSALSYYDEGLVGDFGLYGVTKENADKAVKHYFVKNLELSQNDGFNLYKFEMGDSPVMVSVSDPLSDNEILQDQINEFEKYRAGVNLASGVVDKLKGLFGKNGAASKVGSSVNNVQNSLDGLKGSFKELKNSFNVTFKSAINTQANKAKKNLLVALEKDGLDLAGIDLGEEGFKLVFDDINKEILKTKEAKDTYEKDAEKENNNITSAENSVSDVEVWDEEKQEYVTVKADKKKEKSTDDKKNPLKQAEAAIDLVDSLVSSIEGKIEENIKSIKQDLAEIQTQKNEVKELEQQIKQKESNIKKPANLDDLERKADETKKEYDNYQKDPVEYEEYVNDVNIQIGNAINDLEEIKQKNGSTSEEAQLQNSIINNLKEKLADVTAAGDPGKALEKRYIEAKAAYDEANHNYIQKLAEITELKNRKNILEKEIESLTKDIENRYDGMTDIINNIDISIDSDIEASSEKESESEGIFSNIRKLLKDTLEKTTEPAKRADSPGKDVTSGEYSIDDFKYPSGDGLIDTIISTVEGLVQICSNPSKILDKFYYVDYTLDRFTFLTSHTSLPSHWFQIGEVEYIYNGANVQGVNNVKVLSEIMMIRLAIDFVDDLINTQSPEPISRICIALGRALVDMAKDMLSLMTDGECNLSPSFDKVKLKYSDHLRIMLMLDVINDSGMNEKLNRTKTMINDTLHEKKETVTMSELYMRVEATSNVRINLIMLTLPMFEHVMAGNDTIKDGTFLINETVSMGY